MLFASKALSVTSPTNSWLFCARTDPLIEHQQVQLFTSSLGQPLQTDVELQAPQSLESAMSLARAYERRSQLAIPAAPPPRWPWHSGSAPSPGPGSSTATNSGSNSSLQQAFLVALCPQQSSTGAVPRGCVFNVKRSSFQVTSVSAFSSLKFSRTWIVTTKNRRWATSRRFPWRH